MQDMYTYNHLTCKKMEETILYYRLEMLHITIHKYIYHKKLRQYKNHMHWSYQPSLKFNT